VIPKDNMLRQIAEHTVQMTFQESEHFKEKAILKFLLKKEFFVD
jgi:hypothetical protein